MTNQNWTNLSEIFKNKNDKRKIFSKLMISLQTCVELFDKIIILTKLERLLNKGFQLKFFDMQTIF